MRLFRRLFHRHTWRPLKTLYWYEKYTDWPLRKITVKKCQCYECGEIRMIHFNGKKIVW